MIHISVDQKEIACQEGSTLLDVSLENGIYIPNLCHVNGMPTAPASCRLCMVTVEGEEAPVTACTTRVKEGMVVRTDTDEVRDLQRTGLKLLLSVHDIDCRNCTANKQCELQNIAKFLKVALKASPYETLLKEQPTDHTHPFLDYLPNRCVLCGKCVYTCSDKNGTPFFTYARRGFDTVISAYGMEGSTADCETCQACVEICPVGALVLREKD
jgi:NADH dehydrogenase/NADH:ubiquinone oxidoreductase subunit G